MPIRNYTSGKSPASSAGKMQEILAEHGAERVSMDYEDGTCVAVTFTMEIGGQIMDFRIEPDPDGMLQAMEQDDNVGGTYCNEAQAARTAWKNKLDWLDAQLAEVASNQYDLEQLFLGMVVTDNGQTLYDRIQEDSRILESHNPRALPPNQHNE